MRWGRGVVQNAEVELGWWPVSWTPEGRGALAALPEESTVLHWHGDTFGLPEGAVRLAVSEGCGEQGFLVPGKCLALQFHMEVDPALVEEYVAGQASWPRGKFVQEGRAIAEEAPKFCAGNARVLFAMLDAFVAGT